MKTLVLFIGIFLSLCTGLSADSPSKKATFNYYRLDSIKTVTGKIASISSEKRFHKQPFTVIYLKEKQSGAVYKIEVAPEWFFQLDLMEGSLIQVTGSYSQSGGVHMLMTGSISYQGEIHHFRDKMGFPLWRGKGKFMKQGGKGKGKGRGRGKNHRGNW